MVLEHTAERNGKLASFLRRELHLSTTLINRLKMQNAMFVNGRAVHADYPVAFGDVVLFFFGNTILLFLGMSHPSVFLVSLLPDMFGIAIAVCAAALSHLIYKSARMQQDVDLTI